MGDSDGSLAVRPRSSGPSVRARDVRLGWLDVVAAPPGFRRPGFCRGTVPLLLSLYDDGSWDVKKRFKECTPRPGLVISPPCRVVEPVFRLYLSLFRDGLWT